MNGRITPPDLTKEDFFHLDGAFSNSELLVYNELKIIANDNNWHVHYSFNVKEDIHLRNPQGSEIDFLIITEKFGFMSIEVKGSSVKMNEGNFQQFNHNQRTWLSTKNPFDQIKANNASLIELFSQYKEIRKRPLFSWCVVFPESDEFNTDEYSDNSFCLRDEFKMNFKQFLTDRMAWTKQDINNKKNIITDSLSQLDVKYISNKLRPPINEDPPANIQLTHTIDMIDDLTKKQLNILDSLSQNERFLIEGSAGTGKTYLAKEIFRRKIIQGNRCLFLCHSEPFSISIKYAFEDYLDIDDNPIISFQEMKRELDINNKEPSLDDYINYICNDNKKFDVLVIDEFQDIISISGMELIIDGILDKGFDRGSWFFFGDLTRQATNINVDEVRNKFDGLQIFTYSLDINCRNTQNIHQYLRFHTELEDSKLKSSQIFGEDPVSIYYKSDDDRNSKIVESINKLCESGHKEHNITILYDKHDQMKLDGLGIELYDLENNPEAYLDMKGITHSTIDSFKGLENDILFLYGLPDFEDPDLNKKLYIALSRARYKLYILVDLRQKELMKKFARNINA